MNSQLDIAKRIMRTLADHGHQACLVGGFVRDNWLGRPARDIDIATSATPEEVARLFERTEPTGMRHGTVTVIVDGTPFEVTTFRVESGYADHRRPDSVTFVKSLVNDLSRRDFTMNAMAMTAFCRGRVSAAGPARSRRRRASGFRTARYPVGIRVAAVNTAMNTQPRQ